MTGSDLESESPAFMTSTPFETEADAGTLETLRAVAQMSPVLLFECRKTGPATASYAFPQAASARAPWSEIVDGLLDTTARSREFLFVHPDDRTTVKAAVLRNLVEERDLDLTFRLAEEAPRWVRSQARVSLDEDGAKWDCVCVDVTDLMTTDRVPSVVAGASAIADLSRDLRSPLQAILGFSELLAKATDPDRIADHARNIRSAAGAVLAVLDRFPDTVPSPGGTLLLTRAAEDGPAPDASSVGARVLLADDLDLNRKLIADMLAIDGHVVDCVGDGEAAVAAASAGIYDLILMDMIMPKMDGLAATRAIRALPAPAGAVPIVALTANSFRDQLDSCLDAGMDATLTKPMSIDALTEAVHTWTRFRRTQAA